MATELAGHGRHRSADDPWPDAEPFGLGWAKKQWRDIKVGEFVPDPTLHYAFGTVDDWCHVEALDTNVTLRRNDGTETSLAIDDNQWVPFRTQGHYRWPLRQR